MAKKQIFRIGIKNFPAAHGGVEMCTYNFVKATKDKYDFAVFTVWDNPEVKDNEIDGVRVFKLAKGWLGRFKQIRGMVTDKKNTVLDFQMALFIPIAIVFSLLGYNVVSSIHGISWGNPKIPRYMQFIMFGVDILGANFVRRSVYVAKHNFDEIKHYTFRRLYHNPNGSAICPCVSATPKRDMVFIGRISVQKNLLRLIDAAESSGRELDIYGPLDSRESEYTQKFQAALAGKRHVRYCGALKPEEVYGVLADYKFFINPSSTEASPVAVMEAGACGLYLYLSDIVGHRNLGFPDVHYFKYDHIEIPVHDTRTRSTLNVVWHKENLSIESNLRRYEEVYNSFN